ncbi:hypothetical protein T484DRAFT_1857603 [Baffinella frigidus]|nr:hypothetical protein T484DRAFT_1857603 [Cryptophyta sp. CCMP2293]
MLRQRRASLVTLAALTACSVKDDDYEPCLTEQKAALAACSIKDDDDYEGTLQPKAPRAVPKESFLSTFPWARFLAEGGFKQESFLPTFPWARFLAEGPPAP